MHIVDRRLNPGGKSLENRQRFLRRAQALVRRAVREQTRDRGIRDMEKGGDVSIPSDGVREPTLRRSSQGGKRDMVLPGNRDFVEGDTIARPGGGGGRGGAEGAPDGGGEDDFRFALSQDEFLDLFLDDLELPDLAKRKVEGIENVEWRRAGYSVSGSPANLALLRTMRNSLSRRIALKRPKGEELLELEREAEALEASAADPVRLAFVRERIAVLDQRRRRIPWIDPIDLRYRQFSPYPRPVAQAVMFCLMDVSGSMTEPMKDLAKRFYALLYIFLKRRYKHVEIVFIRHTHVAAEVDEDTFFHSTETGGTVVSTALEEMRRIVAERFRPNDWNIYAAQASDGDNAPNDKERTGDLLQNAILPVCQYFAYLEVGTEDEPSSLGLGSRPSDLWRTYDALRQEGAPFGMRKVRHRRDIFPVFRELFQKRSEARSAP
ncbi:YeaH/YhbH family protein [uncultured Alsobacter sp.]|uniref:YeaH/YhbH family protein n=1 Tax=uncultured Alsobacter sp. TaxID=1748258 RepID=UPI0025FC45AA|nr:YeaH/YhbH family protein [uncultured Alsobacter sp.]